MDYRLMMGKAIAFIEEHVRDDIQPSDVSAQAFYSLPHLYRVFRSTLGCSIQEYIRRRRLSLAAEALLSTRTKVLDIALEFGFGSPESFLRAFKAQYGSAPLAFRHEARMAPLFPAARIEAALAQAVCAPEPRIVFHKSIELDTRLLRTSLAEAQNRAEIPSFWETLAAEGFLDRQEDTYGLYCEWEGEDNFTLAVGFACCAKKPHQSSVYPTERRAIPAARYAVFSLEPFDASKVVDLWDSIYGSWIFGTKAERSGRLEDFEVYSNSFSSYSVLIPLAE
jgi:AraC family transcriptional regulator